MNYGSKRYFAQEEGVAYVWCNAFAADHLLANLETMRSNDIAFLSINIVDKCDAGGAVWIVFDGLYCTGNTILVALKVDDTVALLVTATNIAHGHLSLIVTSAFAFERSEQRLLRCAGRNIVERADQLKTLARGCWFVFLESHLS